MCYLEGGDGFLSPSLRPLPRPIQSTMALEWATIIGSSYLSHRTEVVGKEVLDYCVEQIRHQIPTVASSFFLIIYLAVLGLSCSMQDL